ncbi:carbon-nitrogen hydrolase family protein [Paraburkholderia domus]|uniref:carbon-nitrogen hydrolase family protein n=1 Tax=Paraburkholderia domus TaxID=2793075 RepID=UPI001911E156|nr:carbon-nitrogen hydrolase family protein [Paraburkholderia domus]MBK5052303.1 carbon-nitrogen hydrolase family protein [Burkholderia sp. R-70006]MBK5182138.1 carbon-nitrogen hydrolase family protein [Burkholderia sp. R-69749]MCI0151278.1 carbon-nitrogen hydrolase family protein [Paraburkholderia sediminicola]CAE6806469.1 (R)-stereoselective amidase [Paraburkholderia domus]CAE6841584.1 (R)-stereoselective amidase [Paraburkholderia domus]
MKVEVVQMSIAEAEIETNLGKMLYAIENADSDTDLVVFPETTLCGFPSLEEAPRVAMTLESRTIESIREAARRKGVAVAFGYAEAGDGCLYNAALMLDKFGEVALQYRKTHLWPHQDRPVFSAGDRYGTCLLGGVRVGLLICYDIEFPETARALAQINADAIVVLDGNMNPYGPVHRRAIVARAMENQCFAILANRTGAGRTLEFPGESVVIDPFGEVVAELGNQEQRLTAKLDLTLLERSRHSYSYLNDLQIGSDLRRTAQPVGNSERYELTIEPKRHALT